MAIVKRFLKTLLGFKQIIVFERGAQRFSADHEVFLGSHTVVLNFMAIVKRFLKTLLGLKQIIAFEWGAQWFSTYGSRSISCKGSKFCGDYKALFKLFVFKQIIRTRCSMVLKLRITKCFSDLSGF